jgi:hypothetical protein
MSLLPNVIVKSLFYLNRIMKKYDINNITLQYLNLILCNDKR